MSEEGIKPIYTPTSETLRSVAIKLGKHIIQMPIGRILFDDAAGFTVGANVAHEGTAGEGRVLVMVCNAPVDGAELGEGLTVQMDGPGARAMAASLQRMADQIGCKVL